MTINPIGGPSHLGGPGEGPGKANDFSALLKAAQSGQLPGSVSATIPLPELQQGIVNGFEAICNTTLGKFFFLHEPPQMSRADFTNQSNWTALTSSMQNLINYMRSNLMGNSSWPQNFQLLWGRFGVVINYAMNQAEDAPDDVAGLNLPNPLTPAQAINADSSIKHFSQALFSPNNSWNPTGFNSALTYILNPEFTPTSTQTILSLLPNMLESVFSKTATVQNVEDQLTIATHVLSQALNGAFPNQAYGSRLSTFMTQALSYVNDLPPGKQLSALTALAYPLDYLSVQLGNSSLPAAQNIDLYDQANNMSSWPQSSSSWQQQMYGNQTGYQPPNDVPPEGAFSAVSQLLLGCMLQQGSNYGSNLGSLIQQFALMLPWDPSNSNSIQATNSLQNIAGYIAQA